MTGSLLVIVLSSTLTPGCLYMIDFSSLPGIESLSNNVFFVVIGALIIIICVYIYYIAMYTFSKIFVSSCHVKFKSFCFQTVTFANDRERSSLCSRDHILVG